MRFFPVLTLAGIAGAVYFFDPERGRRRRARARDKLVKAQHRLADGFGAGGRDLSNRAWGTVAEMRHVFPGGDVDDAVLRERVRSQIGRLVGHPRSVEVQAADGCVYLGGQVLEHEFGRLVRAVQRVPGVRDVENRLQIVNDPTQIPGLQGTSGEDELESRFWKPATRLLAGGAGAGLTLAGLRRGGLTGAAMVAGGASLMARAMSKAGPGKLIGIGKDRGIELRKTINIEAPVGEVYRMWSDYENFPRFMSNVREVERRGETRSHWVVGGPLSIPVEWDAIVTKMEPERVVAWRTLPGSTVNHAGAVRFDDCGDGTTRVTVHLTYQPAGGLLGQSVATLFHEDPKTQMDEDLLRMKSFVETGTRARDASRGNSRGERREEEPQEAIGTRRRGRGETGPDVEEMG
jgi:uncharacterized membrane protein